MRISKNIQSYQRVNDVTTLDVLGDQWTKIWVHSFELEEYRAKFGEKVHELPDSLRGNLPKVKNFILECELQINDAVLICDDDISSIGCFERMERFILSPKDIDFMLLKYSVLASEWGVKMWGIQVNPDRQCYREYTPFSTQSYISSSFCITLKGSLPRYDPRFPLKEDYDMTLQQLNIHRKVLRVNKFHYEKKSVTLEGGCSVYRNVDFEVEQLHALQRKWGKNIVKFDFNDRSHGTDRQRRNLDINPVIMSPIKGV